MHTNETIAKVFAAYMPCEAIYIDGEIEELIGVVGTQAHFIHKPTGSYGHSPISDGANKLLLTPLHDISDEHAIEVAKIMGCDMNNAFKDDGEEKFIEHDEELKQVTLRFWHKVNTEYDEWDTYPFTICYDGDIFDYNGTSPKIILAHDYLRGLGYNLPMHILGGKTPIECGIAIDKTKMEL